MHGYDWVTRKSFFLELPILSKVNKCYYIWISYHTFNLREVNMNNECEPYLSLSSHRIFILGIITLFSIFVISACASSSNTTTKNPAPPIPDGASKVVVTSSMSADSLYKESFEALADEGFIVLNSSPDQHRVTAKYAMAADGYIVSVYIRVTSGSAGSIAELSGVWAGGGYTNQNAEWTGLQNQYWKYTFGLIVNIAQHLNGKIKYVI